MIKALVHWYTLKDALYSIFSCHLCLPCDNLATQPLVQLRPLHTAKNLCLPIFWLQSVPAPTPTPDQHLDSDSDSDSSCQKIDDSDSDSSCPKTDDSDSGSDSSWLRFRLQKWSRLQAWLRSRNRPSLIVLHWPLPNLSHWIWNMQSLKWV